MPRLSRMDTQGVFDRMRNRNDDEDDYSSSDEETGRSSHRTSRS